MTWELWKFPGMWRKKTGKEKTGFASGLYFFVEAFLYKTKQKQ